MQRLMWKTVGITLAVIFATVAIVFGALTLFYPKAMGDLFAEAGNYSTTVWFYEKQYGKTQSIEDLAVLVDHLDENKDCEKTEKYSTSLITSNAFNDYVESLVKAKDFATDVNAMEFYYGKCAISNAKLGQIDDTVLFCKNFVERVGYTNFNPFRIVIASCGDDLNVQDLTTLKLGIESLSLTGEKVNQDIQDIQNKINAKGE